MVNASIIALSILMGSDGEAVVIVGGVPTVQVSIAGLDLTNSADLLTVEQRIRRAARRVCSVYYMPASTFYEQLQCKQAAITDANSKIDGALERHAGGSSSIVAGIAVSAAAPSTW